MTSFFFLQPSSRRLLITSQPPPSPVATPLPFISMATAGLVMFFSKLTNQNQEKIRNSFSYAMTCMTGAPLSMMDFATELLSCGATVSAVVLLKKGGFMPELARRRIKLVEDRGELSFKTSMKADLVIAGSEVCASWIELDLRKTRIFMLTWIGCILTKLYKHMICTKAWMFVEKLLRTTREHLLIVCELLKANLYELHKFNRESGGEVYFTMPRL